MKATPQSAIPSAADASTIASVRSLELSVVCTTRTTGAAAGTFDWDDKVSAPIADGAAAGRTPVVFDWDDRVSAPRADGAATGRPAVGAGERLMVGLFWWRTAPAWSPPDCEPAGNGSAPATLGTARPAMQPAIAAVRMIANRFLWTFMRPPSGFRSRQIRAAEGSGIREPPYAGRPPASA